ncbi:MAG: response regulator transcription factor [Cyclobacteriaceae bacterium]|nr:response regulator transcription factor [Cyclobacteriaceae bacterium]
MKLNCAIIDDEPLARNLLSDYVAKVPTLNLVQAFGNPLEALELLRTQPVDILFLDVQMPQLTGTSLLKILQHKPMVILTTAYSEYALEGYELDVADYLLKPVTFERFLKAVDKVTQRIIAETRPVVQAEAKATPDFVFVKDGTKSVKVMLNEILYVEGLKDYVTIHTPTQKIVTLQRMKALEEQLPADRFIRIHNSYIVAVKAIDVVHKSEVQIGQSVLPVGDTYRKSFKDFIEKRQIQ